MQRVLPVLMCALTVLAVQCGSGIAAELCARHRQHNCGHCARHGGLFDPCGRCQASPCACQPAFTPPPVQMIPQQITTPTVSYRDVVSTQYRLQPEVQTVPVTQVRTVAVDEGNWQQIWVPKVVHKQVNETVYQQRTTYRQVPYQVTQRVPQVSYQTRTTMVPQMTATSGCNTCAMGPVPAWPTSGYSATMPAPIVGSYSSPVIASPVYASTIGSTISSQPVVLQPSISPLGTTVSTTQPIQFGRELQPLESVTPARTDRLVPAPRATDSASGDYADWAPVRSASQPAPPAAPRVSSAEGMFVPVPSAARVWGTRVQ